MEDEVFNETLLSLVGCDIKLMVKLMSCENRLQKLMCCNAYLIGTGLLTTSLNDSLYDLHVESKQDTGYDLYKAVYEMMKTTLINAEKRKQAKVSDVKEPTVDEIDDDFRHLVEHGCEDKYCTDDHRAITSDDE